jgi:Spy/CpxP family protein refolding chaperone
MRGETPQGHFRFRLGEETRAMRWLRKLDLTEAQREQIFQILDEVRRLSDPALTRAEILSRVAAVLSPEQRAKLALFRSP